MSKKVGKCPNCGYVYGDQVKLNFPNESECLGCGSELEVAKAVPDKEFDQAMS